MHSLEPEVEQLRAASMLDEQSATRLGALESGATFSLYYELRILGYAAVLLIITGIGLLLKDNFQRIGPLAIAAAVGLAAACCYVYAARKQWRRQPRSIVGDYVLLLGGMLVSADVAFLEVQLHWLGDRWALHLLLLAVFHAFCAYAFDSRLLLSLALAALAGWLGASRHLDDLFSSGYGAGQYGARSLLAALCALIGRVLNQHLLRRPQFNEVFDHYAINFGFWAGLIWCGSDRTLPLGALLTAALSVWTIRLSLQRRSEWFAVYGVVYGAIGLCMVCGRLMRDPFSIALVVLLAVIGAVVLLRSLHQRLRESTP